MDVEELVSTVVLLFDSFGFNHLTISSSSFKFFSSQILLFQIFEVEVVLSTK